jgi:hypothetical protein
MHSSRFQSKIATAALVLMPASIWLWLHGYHGLIGDAQIYAFQALARIHPHLLRDLYLQNTSQDQFTIFSPLYAWFIEFVGLEVAARLLTLAFTIWYLGVAWAVARVFSSREAAWLAVVSLLLIDGSYGGSGVFRFGESFLTARLPAEALIVTSMACYFRGRRLFAIGIAAAALLIHPLIALPGLLLLLCLTVPISISVMGAIVCAALVLFVAGATLWFPWATQLLPVMDSPWLKIVQERSQFLFLQLWSFRDWEINARPFFYLAFTALVFQDTRIRRLCVAAAIVGATGLVVALIASMLSPVSILVQGQGWRWVWIAAFVSTLLAPASILQIWHDKRCGPLCAILLISGLTFPVTGTACISLAMIFWLMRSNITVRTSVLFYWMFIALVLAIVAWLGVRVYGTVLSAGNTSRGMGGAQLRDIFELRILVAFAAAFVWWCTQSNRSVWVPSLVSVVLLASAIPMLPTAFRQSRAIASPNEFAEFSDWRGVIPPTSTVLVAPARDVGTFVWFTLQRPNYLAVDQSAGVVFSRRTALEVLRRSQVLLPVMDSSWNILSNLRTAPGKRTFDVPTRPLTAASLGQICTDPELGFVISPQDIGFNRLSHQSAGPWNNWNLYDCRKARSPAPLR